MFQDSLSSGDQITTLVVYLLGGAVISAEEQELSVIYVAQFAAQGPGVCSWQSLGGKKKERHHRYESLGKRKITRALIHTVELKQSHQGSVSALPCSSGKSTAPQPIPN